MPGSDGETLERRLEAVERAVTESDGVPESSPPATAPDDQLADRLDTLDARVDELDAALQAVRGFLGGVDAVNERIEARANAAVAAVERLEYQLDEADVGTESLLHERGEDGATIANSESGAPTDSEGRPLDERLRDQW